MPETEPLSERPISEWPIDEVRSALGELLSQEGINETLQVGARHYDAGRRDTPEAQIYVRHDQLNYWHLKEREESRLAVDGPIGECALQALFA